MNNHTSQHLNRAIQRRHLIMISLGGAIGTGLFLGSGSVISETGAIGAILAYAFGGFIAYLVMVCLGELAVHMPVAGSFGEYANRYINPSTGYMISWMYWLTWTVTLGTEFTAAAMLMQEWFPQVSIWVWTLIFAATIFFLNVSSTKFFAEAEFWLAIIKVTTVVLFIILGASAIFGFIPFEGHQSAPLFSNLTKDGWFPQGLVPIFTTMITVNFAFSGIELIGVAAGETKNPEQNIPKAISTAIWRLLIFFVGTIIVITALLPYQSTAIGGSEVSSSPFVSVFSKIGIPYAEDFIRFVIITAILSAANSGLFAASRMLWSLSSIRRLPKIFSQLTQSGTPMIAICVTMMGALPGLLSEFLAPAEVFENLMNIAAFTMVIVWISICVSHYNFRKEWYKSGKTKADLKFAAPFYPFTPIVGGVFCVITCLSMAVSEDMRYSFIACLAVIAICYISYFTLVKGKEEAENQPE